MYSFVTIVMMVLVASSTQTEIAALPPNTGQVLSAAHCIAESNNCTEHYSKQTGSCAAGTTANEQTFQCKAMACTYCNRFVENDGVFPCGAIMKTFCMGVDQKWRDMQVSSSCVWTANSDSIVIDLGRVTPASGWTMTSRSSYTGLVYESKKGRGKDSAGQKGKMCFRVSAKKDGDYYFTAVSYGPDGTEHNDVWVNSSKGFGLWQDSKWRDTGKGEWLKGYQNRGTGGISDDLYTKDFDGHNFVVHGVKKDEIFEICLSGRSYKYEMFRLVLSKCGRTPCNGGELSDIKGIPASTCLTK